MGFDQIFTNFFGEMGVNIFYIISALFLGFLGLTYRYVYKEFIEKWIKLDIISKSILAFLVGLCSYIIAMFFSILIVNIVSLGGSVSAFSTIGNKTINFFIALFYLVVFFILIKKEEKKDFQHTLHFLLFSLSLGILLLLGSTFFWAIQFIFRLDLWIIIVIIYFCVFFGYLYYLILVDLANEYFSKKLLFYNHSKKTIRLLSGEAKKGKPIVFFLYLIKYPLRVVWLKIKKKWSRFLELINKKRNKSQKSQDS